MIYSLDFRHTQKKLTSQQAKEKMQEVFQGSRGDDIFDVIWNNQGLRTNLFGVINNPNNPQEKQDKKDDFDDWVKTLDRKIFDFVITN